MGDNSLVTELFLANNFIPKSGVTPGTNNTLFMDCDQILARYNVNISGITTTGNRLPSQNQITSSSTYVDIIYIETTSTSASWIPYNILKSGSTLRWSIIDGATSYIVDQNQPSFNFSNPGTKYITVSAVDGGDGLSQVNLLGLNINELQFLSACNDLQSLAVAHNQLSSLALQNTPNLIALVASFNNITNIDFQYTTLLQEVNLDNTPLSSIDISDLEDLIILNVSSTNLSALNTTYNIQLMYLYLSFTSVSSLNLQYNTSLNTLVATNTGLTSLNTQYNTTLFYLDLSYNSISSVDLTYNTILSRLILAFTDISTVVLSTNTALAVLDLSYTNISSLSLINNTNLINLTIRGVPISSINIDTNISLIVFIAESSSLGYVDVSNNSELTTFNIQNCYFAQAEMDNILSDLIGFNKPGQTWDSRNQTTGQTPDSSLLSQLDAIWSTVLY